MAKANRIKLDLLDEEVLNLIIGGANILPIATFSDLPTEDTGYYYRVLGGAERNNIYVWDEVEGKYGLIGADDKDVAWADLTGIPTTFQPSSHTHSESDIIGLDKYTKAQVDAIIQSVLDELTGKAEASHTHPQSEVTGLDVALETKVDKITGKGLSTNDFTNALLTKLEALSDSASVSYDEIKTAHDEHVANTNIHLSELDKTAIASIANKSDKTYVDTLLAGKASASTVNGHIDNSTVHVTQGDKDRWNSSYTVSIGTTQPTSDMWYKEV